MIFYVTVSSSMPHGSGYWEIHAQDEGDARRLAHEEIPDGRWAFIYDSLEKVHLLDRKRHGVIHSKKMSLQAALLRVAELEAAAEGRCISCGHYIHSCSECGILTDGTE